MKQGGKGFLVKENKYIERITIENSDSVVNISLTTTESMQDAYLFTLEEMDQVTALLDFKKLLTNK